jgi:hypothetical protein
MSDLAGYLLNYGVLGIMCLLLLLGWMVPKPTVDGIRETLTRVRADRDEWRQAYMTEASAHATTREALKEERDRAEVAVETAKVSNSLLASLGHKDGT